MKRAVSNRQRDLFEIEDPPATLPLERRSKVLPLLRTLLMETFTDDTAAVEEGGHDQDHA